MIDVPREYKRNMLFRRKLLLRAERSKIERRMLLDLCREDPIFFINVFGWTLFPTFYPRRPVRPMILYPRQEEILRVMIPGIDKGEDQAILKSRGIGATWMLEFPLVHLWLFFGYQRFLLGSRNEQCVDNPGNYNALFPKLDFILARLPWWMKPKDRDLHRTKMLFINRKTDSAFVGTTRTSDEGRGNRDTVQLLDEFAAFPGGEAFDALAATQDAACARWFPSTPKGVGNAFHHVVEKTDINVHRFHWSEFPPKARGLYRKTGDNVEILDSDHRFLPDYAFMGRGELRSPWYDTQWGKIKIPSIMAQEYGCSFVGSGDPFVSPDDVQNLLDTHVEEPYVRYAFDRRGELVLDPRGPVLLWTNLPSGKPPGDRQYGVGVDVSAGTGASDSCACVYDWRIRKKVCEYVAPREARLQPHEFAAQVAVLGRWFRDWNRHPALIIWESNGPVGRGFGRKLEDMGYENMFYATRKEDSYVSGEQTQIPGFSMAARNKQDIITDYVRALSTGDLTDPSYAAISELNSFEYTAGAKIIHVSDRTGRASEKADNHGDLVMMSSLGYHVMPERGREFEEIGGEERDPLKLVDKQLSFEPREERVPEGFLVTA